jgi:hypothetical protein
MESASMKTVTYVGGSKGGTGKSLVSMALVDYFRRTFPEDKILLIETDSSNPDVGRLYKVPDGMPIKKEREGVDIEGIHLDEQEKGWLLMCDAIEDTDAKYIAVNSMAASNLAIQAQGSLFEDSVKRLNIDNFNVFWVMNRNKDSTTLLRDFLSHIKSAAVYPILNLYFGQEDEFAFYRSSLDIQQMIKERGGRELLFPNMNDLIADKLYTDETNFEELLSTDEKAVHRLKVGMRTSLERWLYKVKQIFDEIYVPAFPDKEALLSSEESE